MMICAILPYESRLQKLASQRATSPVFLGRSIGRASCGIFAKKLSNFSRINPQSRPPLSFFSKKTLELYRNQPSCSRVSTLLIPQPPAAPPPPPPPPPPPLPSPSQPPPPLFPQARALPPLGLLHSLVLMRRQPSSSSLFSAPAAFPATRHETRRLDILASREPSTHPLHRMPPFSCNSSPCRQPLAATKASRRLLAAAELKDCCGRRTAVIQQDGDGGVPPPVHHLFPLAFQLGQPRRPLPLRFQQSRRTTAGLIPKLRPRLAVADSSRGRCAADAPALGAGGQASRASRLRHVERITKP